MKIRKLLSVLLVLAMVLALVPAALAEGEDEPKSTANKPTKKITKTDVDKMQIRAYACDTEDLNPNKEMYSCSPSIKAKGVRYEISEIKGNDEDGYTTDVTFYFEQGDAFEAAAKSVFNGGRYADIIKKFGPDANWKYEFTEDRPATQTLTLYWVASTNPLTGKVTGSWKIPSTLASGGYASNITSAVANLIKVNLKVEILRTVTFEDEDGTQLGTMVVRDGTVLTNEMIAAAGIELPTKPDHSSMWDYAGDPITEDTTIRVKYVHDTYVSTIIDKYNNVLGEVELETGTEVTLGILRLNGFNLPDRIGFEIVLEYLPNNVVRVSYEDLNTPDSGSGISTSNGVVTPQELGPTPNPPQTGAESSIAPYVLLVAAAALFVVSRKRRSC